MAVVHKGVIDELIGQRRVREAIGLVLLAVAMMLAIALASYSPSDPGWSFYGPHRQVENLVGFGGAWFADVLLSALGVVAYVVPVAIGLFAIKTFREARQQVALPMYQTPIAAAGYCLLVLGLALLEAVHVGASHRPAGAGGIVGQLLAQASLPGLGLTGTSVMGVVAVMAGGSLGMNVSWLRLLESIGRALRVIATNSATALVAIAQRTRAVRETQHKREKRQRAISARQDEVLSREAPRLLAPAPKPVESVRATRERQRELFRRPVEGGVPPLDLLEGSESKAGRGYSAQSLEAMSRLLELKLRDFNVDAQVVAVQPGPVVTRFELQPAAGVKVSRITALVKDLARSMAVISVRVVEVIPGRSVVGIEIPNEDREVVRLREILATDAYDQSESPLTLALGKDIAGEPVMVDLARMPHLLVAGTTGSGKSVGVNAMLLSILFKATPEEVRLILIDPKMLELSVYDGIPHLLTPVVTDMKEAAAALNWCVAEMDRRYQVMAALGVRNLAGFNKKVRNAAEKGTPLLDTVFQFAEGESPPELTPLPLVVVVIDEFADMMMLVGKKVEELIARIAQKARAAGIHLLLATQRPSVDVITGLIKANIPGRLSFQVSSKVDSRTILDQGGAEQLLGHGDMLFLPPGTSVPVRIHGAFVADDEVHRVAEEWRARGTPEYVDSLLLDSEFSVSGDSSGGTAEQEDALYDEAVAFVIETRRPSISSVQRRFRIGYNRAARLVEAMQAAGLVSAMNATGGREVLVPDRSN